MTDIDRLVELYKADGVTVTPAQAEAIALSRADSVADFIEYYESLVPPDIEADPAKVSAKFSGPSAMEVL